MPRFALLLLALVLSVACGRPPVAAPVQAPAGCPGAVVVIDPAMGQEWHAGIEQAAAEWGVVGVPMVISSDWSTAEGAPHVAVIKEATPFQEPRAETLGRTARRGRVSTIRLVTFRLDAGSPKFVGVVKHELGHALGIGHSETGLMRTHAQGNPAISANDVAKVCNQ